MTNFTIRPAKHEEIPALNALIALSADMLSREDYTPEEIDAANRFVFGVDSELVSDGTYFVVEEAGVSIACGGWSRRKTLFGGDAFSGREAGFLDPATEAAKIRAFFVHPNHARKGIGRALLAHCEAEARKHGFTRAELMSTLPGIKLYAACGYQGTERKTYDMPNGVMLDFVPMHKPIA